jgi:molybdopterin/thiamine biosynthesis adenylyltransferase
MTLPDSSESLTEEEKARYDRQIRVWGAEAQTRIQKARVLVVGLNGLHPEVVKNIVLAGVGVVVVDHRTVMESDLAYNFFLTDHDLGKNVAEAAVPRIQELNSFASVSVESRTLQDILLLTGLDDYIAQFSEVLVSGGECCALSSAIRINEACRKEGTNNGGIPFFWSSVGGTEGLFVSDFGANFEFTKTMTATTNKAAAAAAVATDLTADSTSSSSSSSSSRKRKSTEVDKEEEATAETETPPAKVQVPVPFPSFAAVINKPWAEIKARKMPEPVSFARCVLMAKLSETGAASGNAAEDLISSELTQNGVVPTFLSKSTETAGGGGDDARSLQMLPRYPSVSTCSILGSYLAQEVIKGISRSAAPNFNASVCQGDGTGICVYPINEKMTSPI